ncbi:MAG: hypothetical protein OXF79_04555 [Chloroflexi bacterium]|nr:hypothetical protein [Chloroflexota bacterium]
MAPALVSSVQAGSSERIWKEALGQARVCEAALNETLSSGAHCLFESGLNLALNEGTGLADEYGKRTFGDHFQVIGNLTYSSISDRSGLGGDLDVVLPLSGAHSPTTGEQAPGSALFLQQGITRWWDSFGSLHSDLRHGLVYRFRVSDDRDADILGISMFHLMNAEHRHEVLVPVIDYSGRWGRGSFRYFSPTTGWTPSRLGYEERALEGMELATSINLTSTLRLNTTGYRWEAEDGSGRWTAGARVDVGWRPHPWLNLSAGYDRTAEGRGSTSFLARLRVPLGSRSKPPRWQGLGVAAGGTVPGDRELWQPTDGIGQIRVATRTSAASLVDQAEVRFLQDAVASGNTVQLEVVLPSAAPRDIRVAVHLVPGNGDNPAVPDEDYVDEPVETTISQGATTGRVLIPLLRNDDMQENRSLGVTVSLIS